MQTIGRRGQAGIGPVATALAAGALFAVALGGCGDGDDGCSKSFSDVTSIAECNALGEQFDCQNADFSTCDIPAGTGSGSAATVATSTSNGQSESQCESGAANAVESAASQQATQVGEATANQVAAGIAQMPAQEFQCGGFTQQHDTGFAVGEITVTYTPTMCAYEIDDVADATACEGLAVEFQCTTDTFVPDLGVCTIGRETLGSNCLVCGAGAVDIEESICTATAPVEVEVTDVDVTVTACLVCDPPKTEPRCNLSGCRDCDGDGTRD